MLFYFPERLAFVLSHNLSRFDGILYSWDSIFLIKDYAYHGDKSSMKPLMRNHKLYELAVSRDGKQLLRLRD